MVKKKFKSKSTTQNNCKNENKINCGHEITHFICIISPEAVDKINCKKTVTPPKSHHE